MEEECFFIRRVIGDIAVVSLRVIGTCQVIPAYRRAQIGPLLIIVLRGLYPAFSHTVVAKIGDNRVIAYASVFWISVCAFLDRYAQSTT